MAPLAQPARPQRAWTLPAAVGAVFVAATALVVWQLASSPPELAVPEPALPEPAPVVAARPAVAPAATAPRVVAPVPLAPAPEPALPPSPPDVVQKAQEQVVAALEHERPSLLSSCWKPAGPGESGTARLTFSIALDASGREIARGVSEDRDAYRPGVADCVRRLTAAPFQVEAPGRPVSLEVSFSLPGP